MLITVSIEVECAQCGVRGEASVRRPKASPGGIDDSYSEACALVRADGWTEVRGETHLCPECSE